MDKKAKANEDRLKREFEKNFAKQRNLIEKKENSIKDIRKQNSELTKEINLYQEKILKLEKDFDEFIKQKNTIVKDYEVLKGYLAKMEKEKLPSNIYSL